MEELEYEWRCVGRGFGALVEKEGGGREVVEGGEERSFQEGERPLRLDGLDSSSSTASVRSSSPAGERSSTTLRLYVSWTWASPS